MGYEEAKSEIKPTLIYYVDNKPGSRVGKVTDKEVINGAYTITVDAYGKFLLTESQYNEVNIGDDIPDYLK